MGPILRGALAGGTAAYLSNASYQAIKDREMKGWECAALQTNHLFLLVGTALRQAGVSLGYFPQIELTSVVLTPIVMSTSLYLRERKISPFEKSVFSYLSHLYQVAVIGSSFALFAFGQCSCGVAMFSVYAFKYIVPESYSEGFHSITKVSTVFAFVGYGSWVFKSNSLLAKVSWTAVSLRLVVSSLQAGFSPSQPPLPSKGRGLVQDHRESPDLSSEEDDSYWGDNYYDSVVPFDGGSGFSIDFSEFSFKPTY